jgi:CubicO group peptidase (beta-lactamase class C family)
VPPRRALLLVACTSVSPLACSASPHPASFPIPPASAPSDLPIASPAAEAVDPQPLVDLTRWLLDHPDLPLFSLLLSRHGHLVYELYTSGIVRDEAHYLMSTTKSFTSAIVGAALDRGLLHDPEAKVSELFPAPLFGSPADRARFDGVTLKDVMGMSALDANEPPHDSSPEAVARGKAFFAAPNRVAFALAQKTLPGPGTSYQYNDVTPMLAGGAVEYATGERLFDFGTQTLFAPMGFKNAEWMHQDEDGGDLASYGLRIRPVDMQKFGILFANGGSWAGRQLLSEAWVKTSFTAYMNTGAGVTPGYKNYGWYWWRRSDWGTEVHWTHGWRGQFIVDIPDYDAVLTMTADFEDTGHDDVTTLGHIMTTYVLPALRNGTSAPASPELDETLAGLIAEASRGPSRIRPGIERRMVPSVERKETPKPFRLR